MKPKLYLKPAVDGAHHIFINNSGDLSTTKVVPVPEARRARLLALAAGNGARKNLFFQSTTPEGAAILRSAQSQRNGKVTVQFEGGPQANAIMSVAPIEGENDGLHLLIL